MEPPTLATVHVIVDIVTTILLTAAAVTAAFFARWRYTTADRQLQQQRFQTASKLLADERAVKSFDDKATTENGQPEVRGQESAMIRVSSIVMLGQLAHDAPEDYHVAVMRIFEIFLTWTTVFGNGRTIPDVESNDVVEAIRFVESRTHKQMLAERRAKYSFTLRGESPFYMGSDGRLRLKEVWVPHVREQLDKRNIQSTFMAERHPTAD